MFTFTVHGKQRGINIKRLIFISSRILLLTIIVVFSFALPVSAEPETVLTGCLNKKSGELHNVALGLKPFQPCAPTETQVTWTSGVPGMESRLIELEQRVAEMESDHVPLDLTVHCPGESVGDALAQAGNRTAHVTINIVGVCIEEVEINRDNTRLKGASSGAGLQAPTSNSTIINIWRAQNIGISDLTLTGGAIGIHATEGALFGAENLIISGASNVAVSVEFNALGNLFVTSLEGSDLGILAQSGTVRMFNGTIESTREGVLAVQGGHIGLSDGTVIRDCSGHAVSAREGGSISIDRNMTIENNGFGVSAFSGGHVTVQRSVIRNNIEGVSVYGGGTIWLRDGVVVANNQGHGVAGRAGGVLMTSNVIIENNGNDGISLGGGSTADISWGTIVRNNIGHGIAIGATSSATFDWKVQVTGNTGTAVICGVKGELDDVALIVGRPGTISGNGSDTIECPRGFP